MGAELGATTSVFPSDEVTQAFLIAQNRGFLWKPLSADDDAKYEKTILINLSTLEPMIACPHSPDAVKTVAEVGQIPVNQVAIGSCTNSSYSDLMRVAGILKGKTVHPNISLVIAPGSRQVFEMLALNGALADLIASGARILESACGPCIGMGQAPCSSAVSVRTFNRNFPGRSGTKDAGVYLASPEVAAATALTGVLTDPRTLGAEIIVETPDNFLIDDSMVLAPSKLPDKINVIRGPNIKVLPVNKPLTSSLKGEVLLKVTDNITTDHIMPAGAKVLPLRSNIPAISEYVFEQLDPEFATRAKEKNGGFILGGHNYGQGSSREHAALAPMYLGIKAVITKSFARIHKANLVNFGILPLTFALESDYDVIDQGDILAVENITADLPSSSTIILLNLTKGKSFIVNHDLSPRQKDIILAGGLLNYTKNNA